MNVSFFLKMFIQKTSVKLFPFVLLVLPLLAGILSQLYFPFLSEKQAIETSLVFFILSFLGHFIFRSYSTNWINGIVIYSFLFFTGITTTILNNPISTEQLPEKGILIAGIRQQPVKKKNSIKVLLQTKAKKRNNHWDKSSENIIAYFRDSTILSLHVGDIIVISSFIQNIQAPKNPQEFDYRNYLAYHLISHQTFIKKGQWHLLSSTAQNKNFRLWFSQLRERIIKQYKKAGISGDNLAVLSALTVGNKDFLTAQIKQSFSSTGAMHVLAVSGLHVGIIYLILGFSLFFLEKRFNWLRIIIILGSLWFYAFLTNLPPSIVRASIMFSFIVIGKAINRDSNIYNTIAASAFFILVISPYNVLSIGFWLSYSAVLGIVYFYPIFYKKIYFGKSFFGKILDKIWALICVSIAAQIATFPVALFFFHQFPNWFILTNLFVIPVVTIIMFVAFFFLLSIPFSFLHALLGSLLNKTLDIQYRGIHYLSQLPYETIQDIHITAVQFVLLYLLILFFAIFLASSKARHLQLIFISLLLFFGIDIYHQQHQTKQHKFIIYAINRASAYNFIDGTDNILFSSLKRNDNKIKFHVKNNWLALGLKNEKVLDISTLKSDFFFRNYLTIDNPHFLWKQNFIQFYNKKMVVFNAFYNTHRLLPKHAINLDYVIISDNANISIAKLKNLFHFKTIIFDNSNSQHYLSQKIKQCEENGINYHSTNEQGAFVIDINA